MIARSTRHIIQLAGFVLCIGLATPYSALTATERSTQTTELRIPVEAELQRYMLATQRFIEEDNYSQAARYLDKAKQLQAALPADFYYFQGIVFNQKNQWEKARTHFEKYIIHADKEQPFYNKSLEMITEIENRLPEQVDKNLIKQDIAWESTQQESKKSASLIEDLKALYLAQSAQEALVTHINTLLESRILTGKRIITNNENQSALKMSISVSEDKKIIVQKIQNQESGSQIMSFKTSAFGLSRSFMTKCDEIKNKCSIRHNDTQNTWFEIAYDKSVAKEIAEAASALVLTLQTQDQP